MRATTDYCPTGLRLVQASCWRLCPPWPGLRGVIHFFGHRTVLLERRRRWRRNDVYLAHEHELYANIITLRWRALSTDDDRSDASYLNGDVCCVGPKPCYQFLGVSREVQVLQSSEKILEININSIMYEKNNFLERFTQLNTFLSSTKHFFSKKSHAAKNAFLSSIHDSFK